MVDLLIFYFILFRALLYQSIPLWPCALWSLYYNDNVSHFLALYGSILQSLFASFVSPSSYFF